MGNQPVTFPVAITDVRSDSVTGPFSAFLSTALSVQVSALPPDLATVPATPSRVPGCQWSSSRSDIEQKNLEGGNKIKLLIGSA
jgi:hypothetical protein